ncbi:tail fiber protein [Chitiniphilus shinanonensis]|uniref:Tail fiber protein n=1 Tax=Chitiniphilus shinanonensis TaxID=553088 RepID=A0ABQ6BPF2_9NEIS|nr:phage tail protein [Chitiniphilus shinanonensis]GLS03778.1 tail fiber protein [Chitiniphilus shinanonensis]
MDYPHSVPDVGLLDGKFTDGDPLTGLLPSLDPASWANAVTDELLGVIKAAGLSPDELDTSQFLKALRGTGVFQTKPQFSNDTAIATTEFVRRQGIQSSNIIIATAGMVLNASAFGATVLHASPSPSTITLPPYSDGVPGARIEIVNFGGGILTIQAQSPSAIVCNGGAGISPMKLGTGDTLTVEVGNGPSWLGVGGTAQLAYSASFSASIAPIGWQKLPGGFLIQWGSQTLPAASTPITFPLAFQSNPTALTVQPAGINQTTTYLSVTPTGFNAVAYTATNGAPVSTTINWIAIGRSI